MLDIIEARHSRSIWETISHAIPNAIDIPFHVIDAVESSSQVVLIVVDKIMHKSWKLLGVFLNPYKVIIEESEK